jgi:hypothetical protein
VLPDVTSGPLLVVNKHLRLVNINYTYRKNAIQGESALATGQTNDFVILHMPLTASIASRWI